MCGENDLISDKPISDLAVQERGTEQKNIACMYTTYMYDLQVPDSLKHVLLPYILFSYIGGI